MTFNQQLIEKARKGEIAILNDGSVEELRMVLLAVWPYDKSSQRLTSSNCKYFVKHPYCSDSWYSDACLTSPPAHSVKDFFMPTTEKMEDFEVHNGNAETVIPGQPRTYRVTRQQMKEIYDQIPERGKNSVLEWAYKMFDPFKNEHELTGTQVQYIANNFDEPLDLLRSIFPDFFHIPEGEPVLVRDNEYQIWKVRISNGCGGAYIEGSISGESVSYGEIIPFTKNPPK